VTLHRWSLVSLLVVACSDADGVVADASSGFETSGDPATTAAQTTTTAATTQSSSASTTAPSTTDADSSETSASPQTTDATDATDSSTGDDDPTDGSIFDVCFGDAFVNEPNLGPDYDQFAPVIGSHCLGTNHQDITDVERVVFLGDSITVGTPPTLSADYYRSQLADALVEPFGLVWGSGGEDQLLWKLVDVFNGTTIARNSGSFASCSKWGARTDDLLEPGTQIADCFPPETRELRTLVVITAGGNDLSSLTQAAIDGATDEALWSQVMDALALQRAAVEWLKDPENFPNGSFVVFANMYEFTDGTGEVESCNVSGLAGFDQPVPSPETLADMVIWANEEFMSIAVDTGSDMIFLLEAFCGHGFNADDPTAPCYRGPDTERWFDLTCIHPNPTGHDQITDMFMSVVEE
jgi:hypothetical protein